MDYWGEGEVNGEDPRTKEVQLYNQRAGSFKCTDVNVNVEFNM